MREFLFKRFIEIIDAVSAGISNDALEIDWMCGTERIGVYDSLLLGIRVLLGWLFKIKDYAFYLLAISFMRFED